MSEQGSQKPALRLSQFSIFNSQFLIALVLVGTLAWSLAFMRIYDGELTRTEASRWIYANVPTAMTLSSDTDGPPQQVQLPVMDVVLQPHSPFAVTFRIRGEADGIRAPIANPRFRLNHVVGEGTVQARLLDLRTQTELGTTQATISPDGSSAGATFAFDGVEIAPDSDAMIELTLLDGSGIRARTSVIANQHFDEGVPFRIEGKDGFGSYYRGLSSTPSGEMQVYNEDDFAKLDMLLNGLDEADYLVLNSNRHYGSVARLPWRFPMINAYYRALMGGELGFELVADFYRFPRIGPFVFNDQEMPQRLARPDNVEGTPPGIEVPYPTAEEAFSVYDHPRVLIFQKTPGYSRESAERILGAYDLTRTIRQTAFEASNTPNGLLLDQKTLEAQQAGGTWSELFPRTSPLNQSQLLAVIAWVALIEVLGVAAFMLMATVTKTQDKSRKSKDGLSSFIFHLSSFIDGGYSFAKTLGLLLVSFAAWWLGSLRILPFTPTIIWGLVAALVVFAAIIGHLHRDDVIALVRARGPVLVASEALFLVAFVFFLLIRAGNPDLWHPYFGGEKPMDFAYLNSVLKATYFPPQDPWFAGSAINYYYFGFVLIGAPIKALGIDPAVAYNIVIPTLFALTACGAFGLGATFYASRRRPVTEITERTEYTENGQDNAASSVIPVTSGVILKRSIIAGLVAASFVVVIGNGDQIRVVGPAWQKLGGIEQGVAAPVAFVSGMFKWLGGEPLPIPPWWPYWNPTRPAPEVMIAEFPHFTFLYADLHAHMMAMPLAFLALAFALAFAAGVRKWPAMLLGAIATGMLWPANTWDYPPYLLLGIAGLALGGIARIQAERQADAPITLAQVLGAIVRTLPAIVAFVALTRLAMAPYLVSYGSAYNDIDPWTGDRTQLGTYVTIYGLFLIPIAFYLLWNLFSAASLTRRLTQAALFVGVIAGALLALRGTPIAILAAPMTLLALAAACLPAQAGTSESSQTRLMWLMTAGAFALTLFVELFTLRGDIGRMNTQFKFYIQAWLMLGVASATALMWVADRLFETRRQVTARAEAERAEQDEWQTAALNPWAKLRTGPLLAIARGVFTVAVAIALFLALLYPAFAIPAKVDDRYVKTAPRGLDGMAYMRYATRSEEFAGRLMEFSLKHDYDAIKWMQDNVQGSPAIIEEGAAAGNQYRWSARFSIYTGLPTVVGWEWHQRQQRAALAAPVVEDRVADVREFYSTTDIEQARTLIRRYNLRYVIVGEMERLYNDPAGFDKFNAMVESGDLRIAYQNPGVTIYEVIE